MNQETVINVITIIAPYILSVVLFKLSSSREDKISKKEVLNKQLECFYVPFYQQYLRGFFSKNKISDMDYEVWCSFLDLFINNIQYMNTKSQSLVSEYYHCFLNYSLPNESDNSEIKMINKHEFDCIFEKISITILDEYKDICHKLKLPKPSI